MNSKKITIFYSWQSDLPNAFNRNFIETAITKAAKKVNKELLLELRTDKDTQNVAGTPDIANTIFDKISISHIFLADVTIINPKSRKLRLVPNPNVLIELGFAASKLGWENVVCVCNIGNCKIEDLPFDLRQRRVISYSCTSEKNKIGEREILESMLESQLKSILKTVPSTKNITNKINAFPLLLLGFKEIFEAKMSLQEIELFLKEVNFNIKNNELPFCNIEIVEELFFINEIERLQALTNPTLVDRNKIVDYKIIVKYLYSLKEEMAEKIKILLKANLYPIQDFKRLAISFSEIINMSFPMEMMEETILKTIFPTNKNSFKKNTGKWKIDIYSTNKTKQLVFGIWLNDDEIEYLRKRSPIKYEGQEASGFISNLSFLGLNCSDLSEETLVNKAIPAFVNEIYRHKASSNHSIQKVDYESWNHLSSFHVGLG